MPITELETPWKRTSSETLDALDTSPDGLNAQAVEKRREQFGLNRLRAASQRSWWSILFDQFKSLVVGLLVAAGALSFAFGDLLESAAIVIVIVINALIGFVTELNAVRSMEALQELSEVDAKVRRDGKVQEIPAEQLVPGDIVVLDGGDVVTADMRLIEASKLQVNESALTGESVPVSKHTDPLDDDTTLAERANMVFKGTAVTRGAGEGVVVTTGMDTELGHISSLVEEAEDEVTPLEKRIDNLGRRLIWVTLAIAAVVALMGVVRGRETLLMIETSIALAVASIPEGLPIVTTIALARGMYRMAQRNAIVSHLSAVETLGATNVILTDKTGTLTENQMTTTSYRLDIGRVAIERGDHPTRFVRQNDGDETLDPGSHDLLQRALQVGVLCNNATLENDGGEDGPQGLGDPLEVALLEVGAQADIRRGDLLKTMPEAREVAFDPDDKMMATYHESDNQYLVAVKGAPDAVLEVATRILTSDGEQPLDDAIRADWDEHNQQMAAEGLRVLALASRMVDALEAEPYEDLTFLGLVGLEDPPREEVRPAIEACKSAGVRVVMVTGDQPVTARNIAHAVGLVESPDVEVIHGRDLQQDSGKREELLNASIFARVSPEQKLNLITLHQENNAIVAMTGDGVNDAPALKKADIGVAMGQRGTQVATEAADMVLKDDAFSTIVVAVQQGRVIFNNIRRFVLYLLSCNVSEVMVVALASFVNAPLPVRPLQILFLNLVTDVFPALALGVGEGDESIMEHPPRDPEEPVLRNAHWVTIASYGGFITIAVLGAFALALGPLGYSDERAVTVSFLTLAFGQLWHVFNMRGHATSLFDNDVVRNRYVWGALVLCTGLLLGATYVPGLNDVLGVVDPGLTGWAVILGMSVLPLVIGQVILTLSQDGDEDQLLTLE